MNKIEKAFGGTQLCKSHGIVEKLCPYCEIDHLTAQLDASRALLAERDGEIERWLCEYNKLKGAAELLKSQLTAAKDAISIYEDGLKALQPEAVMEAEGKYLDKIGVLQQDNRNLRAEIARLQQQSVGWVQVFDENAALREEVERLKVCLFQMQEAAKDTRKLVAQEIVDMLRADRWAESELKDIIDKFGLEG